MGDSGSAAPDDAARARIDSLALELLDGARERFRAYQRELGAKEWAPLYVGEIQRLATCFSPMIDQLVLAHLECGWVPTRIPHAVMACIVSAVNTPSFDTSRGPDYPPIPRMPATYPWMVSTLFDDEQFRSALLGVITQSLAKATESQIRNGLETQSPHGKTNNIATLQRNDGLLKDSFESEDSATEALPTDQAVQSVRKDLKGTGPTHASNNFDLTSETGRTAGIDSYTQHWTTDQWTCTEASLARTARVDPADLSKWKKGSLPTGSDKARRIEDVLRKNSPPTPPARRDPDA